MKLTFWDIVVINWESLWVVVKSWGKWNRWYITHEVYVRELNCIKEFKENDIERYWVRHKYLSEDEKIRQNNFVNE